MMCDDTREEKTEIMGKLMSEFILLVIRPPE